MSRPLAAAAATALAAALLVACGDDGTPNGSATTAPPTTAPPTTAPPTSGPASTTPSGGPGCPVQTPPDPAATVVTAKVTGKTVDPPRRTVSVKLGSKVRIAITTDVADEVHVHTYDLKEDVAAGCTSAIDFVANIPATVEVELEGAGVHVVDLKAS